MSDVSSYPPRGVAEAVAPYGADASDAPHTKLSISLPSDLVEVIRAVAAENGTTVSATIGASLRRVLADVEQERLDRALALDAADNEAWAAAQLATVARLWDGLEW